MKRFLVAILVIGLARCLDVPGRADEKEAKAVVDRAIEAAGGEPTLAKARVLTWKVKGTIRFNGSHGQITGKTTAEGLDHYRADFEADLNGKTVTGTVVVNGDKGWRKDGEETRELDADTLANEKRSAYLQISAVLLVPLKGKGFKLDSAADEQVGEKPVSVIKATGPDGKDFTVYFDKASCLPVKLVAKMIGFQGEEFIQESRYSDYKEFDGIKRATKVETKRDRERFIDGEVIEFHVLDKVSSSTFTKSK